MALFTLADLHLSTAVPKPMDIFGGRWQGYTEKIVKNWRALIAPEDTVVLGGDISWGISLSEARTDFELLESLPGRKLILKGNHDLWWETAAKMHRFLEEHGMQSIDFLHNNCFFYENTALCGTRGWPFEQDFADPHNEKIFRRELMRLEASLRQGAAAAPEEIVCFLHYPPLYASFRCEAIVSMLQKYGVRRCFYGHLHSESLRYAVEGVYDGIEWRLVSGDHVDFTPVLLKK
ncbi:metallophosphoesterase [Butyricicoccus faecihominis]|uniref:metallophosphoesterase n=1 Tax=Butyricicoccus faecihominis TaxID=1712515 RepID=UPI00247A8D4A|nr:metallophosphoesterase [Butyricicoccus faecihominis]MCQ5131182.1 metallophosphoesterase [Butyricicoccus faecihominis]